MGNRPGSAPNFKNGELNPAYKHGFTGTPEFRSWDAMLQRCNNPNYHSYDNYGGRGITVDLNWFDFKNFLEDMGERPSGASLDRIDNDKGYCKSNCRWATSKTQANNRRSNVLIEYGGRVQSISQWADELKINRKSLAQRLRSGWPVEKALTMPYSKGNKKQCD